MFHSGTAVISPGDARTRRDSQADRPSAKNSMRAKELAKKDDKPTNALRDCVLVVDDEILISQLWCMILEDMNLDVCGTAKDAATAIALARKHRPKLVLMDVRLEGPSDGIDAALDIQQTVGSKIIFVTGSRDAPTLARIKAAHADSVLFKPLGEQQLQEAVTAVLQA
jgi:DNA-binding NarL/FixJ family response regulator